MNFITLAMLAATALSFSHVHADSDTPNMDDWETICSSEATIKRKIIFPTDDCSAKEWGCYRIEERLCSTISESGPVGYGPSTHRNQIFLGCVEEVSGCRALWNTTD